VSRYQKGKTSLDFTEARDSERQWHQLGHMQVCTLLQRDNHASTPPLSFYRPDALPAVQPTASKSTGGFCWCKVLLLLAEGSQHIRIRENTLEFSSTVLSTQYLYLYNTLEMHHYTIIITIFHVSQIIGNG